MRISINLFWGVLFASVVFSASCIADSSVRSSFEKVRLSAEAGDVDAQNELGLIYSTGDGVTPKNNQKAMYWFHKAAESGDVGSQINLGLIYSGNCDDCQHITPVNYKKAVYWYSKAAKSGNPLAQFNLGNKYYNGLGGTQSYKEAYNWYLKSASQESDYPMVPARVSVALMYYNGEYVKKDYKKSLAWFMQSLNHRLYKYHASMAYYYIGVQYYNGEGVQKDIETSWAWAYFSSYYGYKPAQHLIKTIESNLTTEKLKVAKIKANKISSDDYILYNLPFPEYTKEFEQDN